MKQMVCIILAAAMLWAASPAVRAEGTEEIETVVTVVRDPDQTGAERPPCFPDPADQFVPLPETENFALGKPVFSGAHTDVYVSRNVNDGKTDTYWESKGFPAEMLISLEDVFTVFTEVSAPDKYEFNADTGNRITIGFDPVRAAWVKVVFTLNTSSRTGGAQAAEIGVY